MDFFVMNKFFQRQTPAIDQFDSAIWTMRYNKHGDFQLVLPAEPRFVNLFQPGWFVELVGEKEPMMIYNHLVEDDKLTVSGPSFTKFLSERALRASIDFRDTFWNITGKPGALISRIVAAVCVTGGELNDLSGLVTPGYNDTYWYINGTRQDINNLSLGAIDSSGADVTVAVPYGPVYEAIEQIAETYQVGMSLYIDTPFVAGGAPIRFRTYKGLDRRSTQSANSLVRFSAKMDSLNGVKELQSIENYKTVAFAFAPQIENQAQGSFTMGMAGEPSDQDFDRRVLIINADDITAEQAGVDGTTLSVLLNQRAADGLANNNFTRVVDGEVPSSSQYKFGEDYGLGDIVELEGRSGALQSARITEFIRTKDSTGEKAYPTVSII